MDTVSLKLGYVVNAGFSRKWGSNKDSDNIFGVKVEVQMADHQETVDDAQFDLYLAAKVGDAIAVGKYFLKKKHFGLPCYCIRISNRYTFFF